MPSPETHQRSRTRTRRVGPDHVELRDDRLTIVSPVRRMPGWDARRYRASLIRFEGRTWRVRSLETGADGLTRYHLEPWDPLDGEGTGGEIDYGAEYVALRDHVQAIGRRRNRVTVALGFIGPLLGFLWGPTKGRLEERYGVDPVASTSASVWIEVVVALGALAVTAIGTMVMGLGANSGLPVQACLLIAIGAVVDAAARWSRLLGEERPGPGFYEWLFRPEPAPRIERR